MIALYIIQSILCISICESDITLQEHQDIQLFVMTPYRISAYVPVKEHLVCRWEVVLQLQLFFVKLIDCEV